ASPTIIVLTADKERSSRDLPFAAGLQRTVSRLVFAQFISRRLVIQIWSALCPSAAKPRRFQGLSMAQIPELPHLRKPREPGKDTCAIAERRLCLRRLKGSTTLTYPRRGTRS